MIRSATFADIPSIITLECECATAAHWTEAQYLQALQGEGPERLLLVAETVADPSPTFPATPEAKANVHSDLLGFLVARHLAPEWELENIVVSPVARRIGLGKGLLNALLAAARETNNDAIFLEAVFLEVRESNIAARSLYEKAGFEQTGRRRSYYANPAEDAVLYSLTLR